MTQDYRNNNPRYPETMMPRVHGPILAIELYGPKNGYYRSYLMDT